jgi:hypothetical protein
MSKRNYLHHSREQDQSPEEQDAPVRSKAIRIPKLRRQWLIENRILGFLYIEDEAFVIR